MIAWITSLNHNMKSTQSAARVRHAHQLENTRYFLIDHLSAAAAFHLCLIDNLFAECQVHALMYLELINTSDHFKHIGWTANCSWNRFNSELDGVNPFPQFNYRRQYFKIFIIIFACTWEQKGVVLQITQGSARSKSCCRSCSKCTVSATLTGKVMHFIRPNLWFM